MKKTLVILLLLLPLAGMAQHLRPNVRLGVAYHLGKDFTHSNNGLGMPNCFTLHLSEGGPIFKNWIGGIELGVIGRDQSGKYEEYQHLVSQGDTFTFFRSFFATTLTLKAGYTLRIGDSRTFEPMVGFGYKVYYIGRENPTLSDNGYWSGNVHFECGFMLTLDDKWIFTVNAFPIEGMWFLNTEIGIKL